MRWIDVEKEEIKDGREGEGGKRKYRAREIRKWNLMGVYGPFELATWLDLIHHFF